MVDGDELVTMAKELLEINEVLGSHWHIETTVGFAKMTVFNQTWENASGGFQVIGGNRIYTQRTYVFIPEVSEELCQVYFNGKYAYSVPISDRFLEDVKNKNVAGCRDYKERYL